ncbi:hypothetical protein DINM_000940 [Dirofilaria immitis]|nr:hypothetical protein [Dirofilaria immitis]
MEDSATLTPYSLRTQLPVTRERFVGLLAKSAYGQAVFDKRKTVQLRDLEFCIKNYEPFSFLNGTLDGWPETSGGKHNVDNESSTSMATKTVVGISSVNEDEEQENLNVNVNGLNNEICDFDESLKGTTSVKSPFDDQIIKKLDNVATAKNTETVDISPET